MKTYWSGIMLVIMSLVAVSTAIVPIAQGGGVVPLSSSCSAGREEDEGCLPRGPGSPARPSGPIHPPVPPPVTPPGTLPITPLAPPPGIPQATRPQDPDLPIFILGSATATLHVHDTDRDIVYTSDEAPLAFMRRFEQDQDGNTQIYWLRYR